MRAAMMMTMTASLLLLAVSGAAAGPKQLELYIKPDGVDLATRTITFKLNRAAEMAEIKVFNLEGALLCEKVETYGGAEAGTALKITWPELLEDPENFRVEMKVYDVNEYWIGWEIVRFYGVIPHEEVVFESGKWEVRETEAPKLDEALPKIVEMIEKFKKFGGDMDYGLYVAGYTDTVGSVADNRELSRKRARAIAEYFVKNGLQKYKLSISVRGFGEEVLAVETGDAVDEERNRRADYIISNFPPQMPGPGSWVQIR